MSAAGSSDSTATTWGARAGSVIPGGSSTGSKRPEVLWGAMADDATLPTHFERASGCRVWTPDGRSFVDCGMALGAVGLGYADPEVTRAVQQAAAAGPVSTLPHRLEVEVAESLTQLIPCAEQVRFLRTGAEATSAAIRIARTLTGRERIVASGYFGWHDWSSDAAGVPVAARASTTWVPFDDLAALDAACDPGREPPAAIIIEPLVHQIASAEWLGRARLLADRVGAVLIFDEVKTAFRVRTGGMQEALGIVPDLTTLGKAMANGYPVAAVVGRQAVMDAVRRSWVSSTAASEATGLAAVQAVIARHRASDVCARMAAAGGALQAVVTAALEAMPQAGIRAAGPPMMWRLESRVPLALDALVAAAARHGVLLKRGAYQFGALAHDDEAVAAVQGVMPAVVESLRQFLTSHQETGS